jgi:hypothetical protein
MTEILVHERSTVVSETMPCKEICSTFTTFDVLFNCSRYIYEVSPKVTAQIERCCFFSNRKPLNGKKEQGL